jgi:putative tricarboxylic transport membrane protein
MTKPVQCAGAVISIRTPATLAVLIMSLVVGSAHAAAPNTWKPDKAVELIAPNAPGGGADRILRIMAKVLQEQRYVEVPVAVVNKPGGGGSLAYAYLNQRPGDGHYLVLGSKNILTNNIAGLGPSYTEFTPLAVLFNEYISTTVKPDSPLRNGRDLIERLKKDSAALSFGIATSLGNFNHQGVAAAFREAGIEVKKVRTVIYQSGSAATTAMLGGHIDVVPISVGLAATMLRQRQVRVLAVTSPARLPGVVAEVPTWREQGYDAVVFNWRGVFGAKGMTPAQIAYWEDVMRRMIDSAEWKQELEANYWVSEFMGNVETRKALDRDHGQTRIFMNDLGLAK